MKKNNKKGFTIVELVIVIAVIGILAAVLIPTFSSVTQKAKDSAALQEARNEFMELAAEDVSVLEKDFLFKAANGRYLIVKDGQILDTVYADKDAADDAIEEEIGAGYTAAATAYAMPAGSTLTGIDLYLISAGA